MYKNNFPPALDAGSVNREHSAGGKTWGKSDQIKLFRDEWCSPGMNNKTWNGLETISEIKLNPILVFCSLFIEKFKLDFQSLWPFSLIGLL